MKSKTIFPKLPCWRSRIHWSFARASATVRFFLLECLNSKGKDEQRGSLPSQLHVQNLAVLPFPIVTLVAEAKRDLSPWSQGIGKPFQGRRGCVQAIQSQRSRKALPRFLRPEPTKSGVLSCRPPSEASWEPICLLSYIPRISKLGCCLTSPESVRSSRQCIKWFSSIQIDRTTSQSA